MVTFGLGVAYKRDPYISIDTTLLLTQNGNLSCRFFFLAYRIQVNPLCGYIIPNLGVFHKLGRILFLIIYVLIFISEGTYLLQFAIFKES